MLTQIRRLRFALHYMACHRALSEFCRLDFRHYRAILLDARGQQRHLSQNGKTAVDALHPKSKQVQVLHPTAIKASASVRGACRERKGPTVVATRSADTRKHLTLLAIGGNTRLRTEQRVGDIIVKNAVNA